MNTVRCPCICIRHLCLSGCNAAGVITYMLSHWRVLIKFNKTNEWLHHYTGQHQRCLENGPWRMRQWNRSTDYIGHCHLPFTVHVRSFFKLVSDSNWCLLSEAGTNWFRECLRTERAREKELAVETRRHRQSNKRDKAFNKAKSNTRMVCITDVSQSWRREWQASLFVEL